MKEMEGNLRSRVMITTDRGQKESMRELSSLDQEKKVRRRDRIWANV